MLYLEKWRSLPQEQGNRTFKLILLLLRLKLSTFCQKVLFVCGYFRFAKIKFKIPATNHKRIQKGATNHYFHLT